MDQYFLCILNDAPPEKDNAIIQKYLNNIFPTPFQYQYAADFIGPVADLLKPISRHVAVLNTCEENKDLMWKLLNEDVNILEIIEDDFPKTDSAIELDPQDYVDYISASLHLLADQLPAVGSYKLDILLGSDVLRELSIRKAPTLVSAFTRLTRWHAAHFTIFKQKEFDSDRLSEWCEIINVDILQQDSKLDLGPCLWRGAVQFHSSNTEDAIYKGFQLTLDLEENKHSISHSVNGEFKQVLEHIVLSSKLQVIDEVSFASIPPYLICPVIFRLDFCKLNVLNEGSSHIIEYLLKNEKAAFIVKLGFAEMKDKVKSERKYCSNRWQKAIISGYLKDSECFVTSFEKSITFAVTKSNTSDCVVAYPLQDLAHLNADYYFNIVKVSNMASQVSEDKCKTEVPITYICPKILHRYLRQHMDHKNGYCGSKSTIDSSSFMKNTKQSPCFLFQNEISSILSFEEVDPSDWPERIQLLHKQMKKDEKEYDPVNSSLVQNLKLPFQSFSLSCDIIAEHFLPSGEHKKSKKLENIYSINNIDHLVTCDRNDVLQSKWPEIINLCYHDLYYNSSHQAEEKESFGSQLVRMYVQHETASTCNKQQLTQNFQITVSEKISSPSKAFRGPSTRVASVLNEKNSSMDNISPRKNSLKDLITKKILSSSHVENVERKTVSMGKSNKNPKCKHLVPVRSSPRKRNPVNYKSTSFNRNSKNNSSQEPSKMNDLLRKKLRNAVATALEDNGINSTHPMYQPCGVKLLNICKTFLDDLKLKKGKTSEYLKKIADAHVKQVIEFYQD